MHDGTFTAIYTASLMTNPFSHVIVSKEKTGPQVRKGEAMLQIHTQKFETLYRPYDLMSTIMPSADKAEWFNKACLHKAGSSGYLGPGASMRILE